MKINSLLYILPLFAGIFACVQSNINGYWQTRIGIQMTILINGWIVAILSTILYLFGSNYSIKNIYANLQPSVFFNGFLGFGVVIIAAFTFPKLGAASVMVTMIMGQVVMGLILDHFGFLNLSQRNISSPRLIGLAFIITGVFFTIKG